MAWMILALLWSAVLLLVLRSRQFRRVELMRSEALEQRRIHDAVARAVEQELAAGLDELA